METSKGKHCFYEGREYENGWKISGLMQVIVCRDGEWHDQDEDSANSRPSLAYMYH